MLFRLGKGAKDALDHGFSCLGQLGVDHVGGDGTFLNVHDLGRANTIETNL